MLWLPTAIVLVAGAVQELADESAPGWWACNVHVTWVLLAFAVALVQLARSLGHGTSAAAFGSIALIVAQSAAIVYAALASDYGRTGVAWAWGPTERGAIGVGGDGALWANAIASVAVFLYSWCPIFIAVETCAAMTKPEEFERALVSSYMCAARARARERPTARGRARPALASRHAPAHPLARAYPSPRARAASRTRCTCSSASSSACAGARA